MATFVITMIGDDRPGLLQAVSEPVSAHGGSWERSQLSRLAGRCAGIVQVSVPDDREDALAADLRALGDERLQVVLQRVDEVEEPPAVQLHLDLLGADHPGIVAEISAALAERGVSIEEFETEVRDAPMAGGTLFAAQAVLRVEPGTSTEPLRDLLEGLANELMVEIRLSDD
jgi:glycine cleavage system regulatory protein